MGDASKTETKEIKETNRQPFQPITTPAKKKQKKRWQLRVSLPKKNLALFVVSLIIMVLILEAGFRVFYPQKLWDECVVGHPDSPGRLSKSDKLLGHVTKPNLHQCLYQPDTNKKITVTTNSKGQRTLSEYTYQKPANTIRILLFGDSFLLADMLDDDETFQVKLQEEIEKILAEKYTNPPAVEIIPFSMGSYGTQQSLLTYIQDGQNYEFDIAMYLFYQNDIDDSFSSTAKNYPRPQVTIEGEQVEVTSAEEMVIQIRKLTDNPYYFNLYFNEENVPIPKPPWRKRFLLGHSHLFSFVDFALARRSAEKDQKESDVNRLLEKVAVMDPQLLRLDYKRDEQKQDPYKERPDQKKYIVKQVVAMIGLFNRRVHKKNETFVLMNIPSVYQTKTKFKQRLLDGVRAMENPPSEVRHLFNRTVKNLFGPTKKSFVLAAAAERDKIPYIDLIPIAEKYEDTFYFKTDDHWSPIGAAVSAKYVAEEFKRMGLLNQPKKRPEK